MSGTQGPLETKAATTVDTPAALSALDAAPWSTGELAAVISLGVPGTPALFSLQREDAVSVVNGTTVLAVGPNSAGQGRWLRLQVVFGPPVPPPGGAGPMILEGWFVGLGEGEIIVEGGVGIDTPPTEMNRFSAPLAGAAPNNQYPVTEFWPSVAGTITELQIVTDTPMSAAPGQSIIGQVSINAVLVGTQAILDNVTTQRAAVVQALAYVPGDRITISWSTINNVNRQANGLIGMLRVQE